MKSRIFSGPAFPTATDFPFLWNRIINPTGKPAELLQEYLEDAINGDGPHGELIWQTILNQSFDMVRDIYLNLTLEDRMRFDKDYTSVFFTHAASQPAVNAEKLLALMKAGMVDVLKLGDNYRLKKNDVKDCRGNLPDCRRSDSLPDPDLQRRNCRK